MAKSKHKIPTTQLTIATAKATTPTAKATTPTAKAKMPTAGAGKVPHPKPYDYEIELNPQGHKIEQFYIRFGTTKRKGNYTWVTTMDMGPVKITRNGRKTVGKVRLDDSQIPRSAESPSPKSFCYQALCEIKNKHGETELLMTKPTLFHRR